MFSGKAEPPPLSEQELVIPSWRTGEVAASASASYRPSHRRNASLPPVANHKLAPTFTETKVSFDIT